PAKQGESVHDEAGPPLQQLRGCQRLLPASGDPRGEHELQPGERFRRRQLSAGSRDQDGCAEQHVRGQFVHSADAARWLESLRRQLLNDRSGNPLNFNVATLGWPTSLLNQMADTQRFPTMSITGYKGSGWTNRQANGYYQYGANGTLSKLTGTHNVKMGGDYRVLGVTSANFGASTGTFTFTGLYTNNALADLLMGYPQSGNAPVNTNVNGYVRYYSAYAQDDWRVNQQLSINSGLRFAHDTGLAEKDNQIPGDFAHTALSP